MDSKKIIHLEKTEKIIGKNIAEARVRRGLTGQVFAGNIGVSVSYLSRIENGRQTPSLSFLRKVSDELNINIASLLFSEKEKATLETLCSSREVRELISAYQELAIEDKRMMSIFLESLSVSRRKNKPATSRLVSLQRAAP